MGKYGEI